MWNDYERKLILSYLSNTLRYLDGRSGRGREVGEWLAEHETILGVDGLSTCCPLEDARQGPLPDGRWSGACGLVERALRAAESTPRDQISVRLEELGQALGLCSLDVAILELLLRCRMHPAMDELLDAVSGCVDNTVQALNWRSRVLPCVLGVGGGSLRARLAADAPLVRTGLVWLGYDDDVGVVQRLGRLRLPASEPSDAFQVLWGAGRTTDLDWSDFEHLGQGRDDVAQILRGTAKCGAPGVNILLHGPCGTGKTEFCQVLAQYVGADLFAVGDAGRDGGEPCREERMADLRLARSLFGERPASVLLFDEADDVLSGADASPLGLRRILRQGGLRGYSKVFVHRLLEETPVPTLWTTNSVEELDPAILRRMNFALELRQPSAQVRARIWTRQLSRHDIEATPAQALALAREFDISPGVAAGVAAGAAVAQGDIALVRRGVRSLSTVLGCRRSVGSVTAPFDPTLLEADIDLKGLADRLVGLRERRFSMFLQGPSGTGKSAYARYVAERLGLEARHMRTSDLLGMYVGQTERNIARAFAEARADEAFLIFDEADSLLADRRGAQRNWEISQVNEMLTWMEDHPLPFACTTNYGEKLDAAVLRRFTFKATLKYLGKESARAAFYGYFGLEAPPELDRLTVLAPGDFHVARRKAEVLGILGDGDALVEMLRVECFAKPDQPAPIGFARA